MAARIDDLYETDFYAWTQAQAKALRGFQATRPNVEIDWRHLIAEVEDLGKEQRNALRSWTTRIIEHLLLLGYSRAVDPRHSWMGEIIDFRDEIESRLTPTLRRDLSRNLPRLYGKARERVVRKSATHRETSIAARLPETCPWTLAQLLDPDWWPGEPRD